MVCPDCGCVITTRPTCFIYDELDVWHGSGPELKEYTLQDGRMAREVVQAIPWSSGPVVFLCLEIDGEHKFTWSDEEIDNLG